MQTETEEQTNELTAADLRRALTAMGQPIWGPFNAGLELIGNSLRQVQTLLTSTPNLHPSSAFRTYRETPHTAEWLEKRRERWHQAVICELDVIEHLKPTTYQCLPVFLATPEEQINGLSYTTCFYGKLNGGNQFAAMLMTRTVVDHLPYLRGLLPLCANTPIESLVMALYQGGMWDTDLIEYEGVTREVLKGWMQEHYRASQEREAIQMSEGAQHGLSAENHA